MEQAGLARALWVLAERLAAAAGRGFTGAWVPGPSTLFSELLSACCGPNSSDRLSDVQDARRRPARAGW